MTEVVATYRVGNVYHADFKRNSMRFIPDHAGGPGYSDASLPKQVVEMVDLGSKPRPSEACFNSAAILDLVPFRQFEDETDGGY